MDPLDQIIMIYADKSDDIYGGSGGGRWDPKPGRKLKYTRKPTPLSKFVDSGDFDKDLGGASSSGHFTACMDPEGFLCVVRQDGKTASALNTGTTRIDRYDTRNLSSVMTDPRNQGVIQSLSDSSLTDVQFCLLAMYGETTSPFNGSEGVYRVSRSTLTPYKSGLLFWTGGFGEYRSSSTQPDSGPTADLLITLGGFSNYDSNRKHTDSAWVPSNYPYSLAADSTKVGHTTSGTVSYDINTDGYVITSSSGSAVTGFDAEKGASARIKAVTEVTLNVPTNDEIAGNCGHLRAGNVILRFGKYKAQIFQKNADSTMTKRSAVLTLTDEKRDWMLSSSTTGKILAFYKLPNETAWTQVACDDFTDAALGGVGGLSFGNSTGLAGGFANVTATTQWDYVTELTIDPEEWIKTNYHPRRLYGKNFSLNSVYMDDGWSIESKGSVAFAGDHWKAETDYGHSVRLMHPEIASSPRINWQSLTDKSECSIEWNPDGGMDTRPLGGAVAVHLQGVNFKTAHFEGWNGSAWVTLGTINTAKDFTGLKFARDGNIIRPNPAAQTSAGRYVKLEELKNYTAIISPGTGGESRHTIQQNSEGSFSTTPPNEHGKPCEILLSDSVTSLPATGEFEIWEDRGTVVMWGRMTAYDKFRLRMPAQDTKDGYFKIGACIIGPLLVFGTDYSWGRSIAYQPNQEITTARSGDRIVEELGPIRRKVQFAWAEGWDARPIGGDSAVTFDTLNAGSAYGVGVRNDPFVMAGAMYRLSGAYEPTVYLPRIPHDSDNSGSEMIVGRDRQVYGRIISPVTQTTVLGDEDESEVITLNQIVIEEEV